MTTWSLNKSDQESKRAEWQNGGILYTAQEHTGVDREKEREREKRKEAVI